MKNPVNFLTIKEAAERYSKAEITIRRHVRDIVRSRKHGDRKHIQPSPIQSQKLKKLRKPFSYRVSTDFLERIYGPAVETVVADSGSGVAGDTEHRYTDILERQLKVKDAQIHALTSALESLNQRQRETNILMKGLQEQLLLPAPKKKSWWLW